MTINRKVIIYAISAAVLIVVIAVGTAVGLNMANSKKNSANDTKPTQASVNDLRGEAEKARASNDKEKAKLLLLQAQKQNSELPKTDATTATAVDIAAQQCLLGVKSACKGY